MGIRIRFSTVMQGVFMLIIFCGSDAVVASILSGGVSQAELDPHNPLTSKGHTIEWVILYPLILPCLALGWRSVVDSFKGQTPLMLLLFLILVSVGWSSDPITSVYDGVQLVILTLFGLQISQELTPRQAMIAAWYMFIFIVFVSIVFVVALPRYGIDSSAEYNGAWRGAFVHKQLFGTALTFAFASFIVGAVEFKSILRVVSMIMIPVTMGLLYKSQSKTGLIASAFLPCAYIAVILCRRSWRELMLMGGLALIFGSLAAYFMTLNFVAVLTALGKDATLTGRTQLWAFILSAISEWPFFGFGYDAFFSDHSQWGGGAMTHDIKWHPTGAHNGWLEVATQLGIVGAVLLFFVVARAGLRLLRICLDNKEPTYVWVMLVMTGLCVWSLFQANMIQHNTMTHLLWTMCFGYSISLADKQSRVSARSVPAGYDPDETQMVPALGGSF